MERMLVVAEKRQDRKELGHSYGRESTLSPGSSEELHWYFAILHLSPISLLTLKAGHMLRIPVFNPKLNLLR